MQMPLVMPAPSNRWRPDCSLADSAKTDPNPAQPTPPDCRSDPTGNRTTFKTYLENR
jgi:hypothetical protein